MLPGGLIGAGAVVTDSVVGFDATVEPGARVLGFTLVGDGATVAAGEVLRGRAPRGRPADPGSALSGP